MSTDNVTPIRPGLIPEPSPPAIARHPRLAASLLEARASGFELYPEPAVCAFLERLEARFPGMQVSTLRPVSQPASGATYDYYEGWSAFAPYGLIIFQWSAEAILAAGLLTMDAVPPGRKRICTSKSPVCEDEHVDVYKRAGGRLEVITRVPEDAPPQHPLAFFSPASVCSGFDLPKTGEARRLPQTSADWKSAVGILCEMVTSIPKALGGFGYGNRFRLEAESLARVQARTSQYLAELLREIDRARVIDSAQPQRRAGVHLAIDNTKVRP